MNTSADTFAQEFKDAREAAGLTQAGAAEVLQITRRGVQQWESGERIPTYPTRFGALVIIRGLARPKEKGK